MIRVTAIVVAGGRGERVGAGQPKQFLEVAGRSLLQRSVSAFLASGLCERVIAVLPAGFVSEADRLLPGSPGRVTVTTGGARRQDSVAAGFDLVARECDVVLVHDAARPFVGGALIAAVAAAAAEHGAAIAALPARDTVKRGEAWRGATRIAETIPRETVHLAQTPQGFRREVLAEAVALGRAGRDATDEAALAEAAGHPVVLVPGHPFNIKVTTPEDLPIAEAIARAIEGEGSGDGPAEQAMDQALAPFRIGIGYDSHRFGQDRPLRLGGVVVPHSTGLVGHSDADAVSHALTDAILGAANLGDIGQLFPDRESRWKDADSLAMLGVAVGLVREAGYRVGNVDVVVVCEQPRIGPYAGRMRETLAPVLGVSPADISIKGKTNERMDATGHGEGLVVHAVATIVRVA